MSHSLLVRGASVSLTIALMLPAFAAAAGPAPLGTLRATGAVYVESTAVPSESSLFPGDHVRTEEGRASLALAHGSSVIFEHSSRAILQKTAESLSIGLEKGRLTFNSNPQTPIQVKTAGMALLPSSRFPSLAEVAMLADGSVSLAVHRGEMMVRSNGKEQPIVVKAGRTLTVVPQKDETPGTAAHGSTTMGQKAQGVHLSHGASMMLIGGIVVATAAAIAIPIAINNEEAPASPSTP